MQQITIHQDRIKPFLQRHAWVFSGAVKAFSNQKAVGIAEVISETGTVLGYAFSDPESQIVGRIFHFGQKPPAGFNLAYWKGKFQAAFQLRTALVIDENTDTYRLINAEGDEMAGMIVDVYGGKSAVIHTLIDATGQWIGTWVDILKSMGYESIYHKHAMDKSGKWLLGSGENAILATENGLKFWIDVEKGQKTGFFIDQRDNRKWIGSLSKNKKVLNAFGFTGGFSVYALAAGAKAVVTVDISKEACLQATQNVAENQLDAAKHESIAADCFDYLKEMPDDFDVIVLDPPAFSKSKSTVDKASRGYKEINLSAMRKIKSGGILATFSCSQHIDKELFRKIVFAAAVDSGRMVRVIGQMGQPADHPVNICQPEGDYLKGLLLYVD